MIINLFAIFMVMKYDIWGGNALSGNVLNVVNTNIKIIYMENLEKTGKVHPDMLDLMQKAQKSMQEAGIWEDIMSKPSKFE